MCKKCPNCKNIEMQKLPANTDKPEILYCPYCNYKEELRN
jgi:hypothetical protein